MESILRTGDGSLWFSVSLGFRYCNDIILADISFRKRFQSLSLSDLCNHYFLFFCRDDMYLLKAGRNDVFAFLP